LADDDDNHDNDDAAALQKISTNPISKAI